MALLTNINGKFSVSDAGAVRFNDAFTFPTADGDANYILKTNGSGQLAWGPDNNNGDITGSGTANKVTKFTGAKTIGDGPITFATNDSTFAGSVTATSFNSSSTTANIFLGSVITKPGDNLGFIVRNDSNAIIGSLLRTSNTASKLTADTLDLSGTTAQYVRGDGSFATYSPGTGTVTGSGTLNKVPRWTATGSNLGDGPITFATNDSTFAGKVTTDKIFVAKGQNVAHVASSIIISQESTTKSQIRFYGADTSTAGILEFTGSTSDGSAGGARLTINADGSSTFAGTVTTTDVYGASSLRVAALGGIHYVDASSSLIFRTSGSFTERMRIDQTHGDKTFISSYSGGTFPLRIGFGSYASFTPTFVINDSGSVGIGTDSPAYSLEVENSSTAYVFSETTGASASAGFRWKTPSSEFAWYSTGGTNAMNLYDYTAGAPRITVNTDGNVGIGTQAPAAALDIKHATVPLITRSTNNNAVAMFNEISGGYSHLYLYQINAGAKVVISTNGNSYFNGGNVGIGTTSPDRLLEISHDLTSHEPVLRLTGTNNLGYAAGIEWQSGFGPKTSAQIFSTASGSQGGELWINVRDQATNALVRRMYFKNNGYIGIGTSAPATKLHVSSANAVVTIEATTSGQNCSTWYKANGNNQWETGCNISAGTDYQIFDRLNSASRMVVGHDGNVTIPGNVGIGATPTTTGMAGNIRVLQIGQRGVFSAYTSSGNVYMSCNVRVLSNGNNVAITSGVAGQYRIADDQHVWYSAATANAGAVQSLVLTAKIDNAGTFTAKGDVVAYGSPSDKRLKENIKPIESALDKVSKLQGVTFDWKKSDSILDIKEDIGFIAQDVQKVVPELVRENEDGMLSMRHQGIAPILLEAIKELKVEIEKLKSNKCNCNK